MQSKTNSRAGCGQSICYLTRPFLALYTSVNRRARAKPKLPHDPFRKSAMLKVPLRVDEHATCFDDTFDTLL